MKSHASQLSLLLLTAMAALLADTAAAFTTPLSASQHRHSTARRYEDSEWYTPPPPAAEPAIRLPAGVTPHTTVVTSRAQLEEFLKVDDRLCVVKFHAAWYVHWRWNVLILPESLVMYTMHRFEAFCSHKI